MDQIRDELGRLSELDDAALEELSNSIVSEFESVEADENITAETVQTMTELADALDAVKTEKSQREVQAAELATAREAAAARVHGAEDEATENVAEDEALEDSDEAEVASTDDEVEDPADEDTDPKKKKKKVVEEEEAPVVVAASADEPEETELSTDTESAEETEDNSKVDTELSAQESEADSESEEPAAELNVQEASSDESVDADAEADVEETETNREDTATVTAAGESLEIQAPEDRRPTSEESTTPRATVGITAGADIPGVTAGSDLPNMSAIAEAMAKRMHGMRRTSGGDGEQHTVASIVASYPEDRVLHSGDIDGNSAKIAAVASPQAVTAAGGFCAPVEVSYDLFGFGSTDRPVKDALASFSADRGGIRYTTSPVLGDLDGAVSTWTKDDDIAAAAEDATNVKPCLRVECGEEVIVYTDAIPLCLTFGNLQSRAFPELVERNNELALVTQARYAEQRLLTRIGTLSTNVSTTQVLGAARDFFNQVDRAAAGYRSRHRLDPEESLRVIAPYWLKNLIRVDLVSAMPGDGQDDTFGLAERAIDAWFAVRHINVSWTLDGEAGQIFGAQNAGALNAFPSSVVWYIYAEGTFLFLDGGTLDLGLVRDSSLNATNDYKMFVETFEGVAKVGIEALRVSSPLKANGASAGTVNPA